MKKSILVLTLSAFLLGACDGTSNKSGITDKIITVGASSTPHALILEKARSNIEKKGYELDIKIMTDYVTPNLSLDDGDLDANYFQHEPYLFDFNLNQGTDIISVAKIHFEPMGVYVGKNPNGKIIIPNDKSNGDRAKELLKLHNVQGDIIEAEAQTIPLMLDDCKYACVNGNYALESKIINKYECIFHEDEFSEVASKNANVIAVKRGNETAQCIKVLVEAVKSSEVRSYIYETFGSAVIPTF